MSEKRGSKAQKIVLGAAMIVLGYVVIQTIISIASSIIKQI